MDDNIEMTLRLIRYLSPYECALAIYGGNYYSNPVIQNNKLIIPLNIYCTAVELRTSDINYKISKHNKKCLVECYRNSEEPRIIITRHPIFHERLLNIITNEYHTDINEIQEKEIYTLETAIQYKTPTPLANTIKAIPPVLTKCAIHLFSQINLKPWNTSNPYGLIVIPHWATL